MEHAKARRACRSFTIGDTKNRKDVFSIRIPSVLSILACNQPTARCRASTTCRPQYEQQYGPGNYVPNVFMTYWTFRVMVGAGFLMLLLALLGASSGCCGTGSLRPSLLLALLPFTIALPYLANTSGWLLTELGRQPWIVFGLMLTAQGVSTIVPAGQVAGHADRVHADLRRADRGERLPAREVRRALTPSSLPTTASRR